jgi:hypothetical protein
MDLEKDGRRLALRAVSACIALLINTSCAQRAPSGNSGRALIARPAPTADAAREPARQAAPPPAPERRAKLQTIVPKRELTKAEQIITLVREGYFVGEARGAFVFSKSRLSSVPASGLYEDAILLGRLRQALKETASIPDSLSATATVRDARAFLTIDDGLSASEAARAIDAALRTPGVNSVQARISG